MGRGAPPHDHAGAQRRLGRRRLVAEGVEGIVHEAFYESEDGTAVTFERGTWGSSESAAEHADDTYFSGPGILVVQHDRLLRPTMLLVK